jgi:hypothetical protein
MSLGKSTGRTCVPCRTLCSHRGTRVQRTCTWPRRRLDRGKMHPCDSACRPVLTILSLGIILIIVVDAFKPNASSKSTHSHA